MEKNNSFDNKINILIEYLNTHIDPPTSKEIYKKVRIKPTITKLQTIKEKGKVLEDGSIKYQIYILSKENIDKLNNNNFNWEKEKDVLTFDKKVKLLQEYYEKNNHKTPPIETIYKGFNIGNWCSTLRMIYNHGQRNDDGSIILTKYDKKYKLAKEQIDMLNNIHFDWNMKKICKYTWFEYYNAYKEYSMNNKELPEYDLEYNGIRIGYWIRKQRTIYNNGERMEDGTIIYNDCGGNNIGILTDKQMDLLNKANKNWNIPVHKSSWDYKFDVLKEYLEKHNGNYPKEDEIVEGFNLRIWITKLRLIYNNGILMEDGSIVYKSTRISDFVLTKDQIDRLNSINFIWTGSYKCYYKRRIETKKILENKRRFLLE